MVHMNPLSLDTSSLDKFFRTCIIIQVHEVKAAGSSSSKTSEQASDFECDSNYCTVGMNFVTMHWWVWFVAHACIRTHFQILDPPLAATYSIRGVDNFFEVGGLS